MRGLLGILLAEVGEFSFSAEVFFNTECVWPDLVIDGLVGKCGRGIVGTALPLYVSKSRAKLRRQDIVTLTM